MRLKKRGGGCLLDADCAETLRHFAAVEVWGIGRRQGSLLTLDAAGDETRREALMAAPDAANRKFGRKTVFFGAQGPSDAPWHMRQARRSPRLTTAWDELAAARC